MKGKIFFAVLAVLLLVSSPLFAADKIVVTDSPTTHHTNIYMGMDMGIFEKYGLEVEYLKAADPAESFQNVIDGKADLVMACPTATIVKIANGAPLRVIAQIKSPCTSILTIKSDSPIKTIADLKGKKIAGLSPTCEAVIAFRDAADKDNAVFEIVKASPQDAMSMLESGEIDGAILEEPFASEMELKGYNLKFRELIQVPCRFLSGNTGFLKNNSAAVKKFIEAMNEINDIYDENPLSDEIVNIAAKYTGGSEEAIRNGMVRIHFLTELNTLRIKALMASLVRIKAIPRELNDEEIYAQELKGITW